MRSNFCFFRKSCHLRDNVKKYGRGEEATDNNIIRLMRIACWINKATSTQSEYLIPIVFPQQQWLIPYSLQTTKQNCVCISHVSYVPYSHFTSFSLTTAIQ